MINVKEIFARKKINLAKIINEYPSGAIKLSIIQVGNNLASNSYIKGKLKDCTEVGIIGELCKFPETAEPQEVCQLIEQLNVDKNCKGIIVQLPLPNQFTPYWIDKITQTITPYKDVDGFRSDSPYLPCTPKGILTILAEVLPNEKLEGKVACVIGRSNIVGKPMVKLLIEQGCTVISCNSHTVNLDKWIRESDIVICAVGQQNFLSLNNKVNWENKIIIDVGINRNENGKLCGDCSPDLYEIVDLITPVPGGVGLTTRLSLLENTVEYLNNKK